MITKGVAKVITEYARKNIRRYRNPDGTYSIRGLAGRIMEYHDLPPTAVDALDLYNLLVEIAMEDEQKETHTDGR